MDWILWTIKWYFYLLIVGIIFFPITRVFFKDFVDQGYAFSKTIGILFLSFAIFILGNLHILPFSQISLLFILVVIIGVYIYLYIKGRLNFSFASSQEMTRFVSLIAIEELLFIASLFFLAFIRGQEPSIRGLEKFMDFGFMNSLLRSTYFPPIDMWYSPDSLHPQSYPINYYYFGHLTGSLLIKLINISPFIGYNLILATILAQGTTLAFSLTANIIFFYEKYIAKIKEVSLKLLITFGILGSFIVNFAGNLHTIYVFTTGYNPDTPTPFWKILSGFNPAHYWYPNATRFIPFTIHEFPSYSYVVADLHGHVFDIPFVLLTLALLLMFIVKVIFQKQKYELKFTLFNKEFLTGKFYIFISVVLGFMTAIHYMTNAWDMLIYGGLIFFVFLVVFRNFYRLFFHIAIVITTFIVCSLPFSIHFNSPVSSIGVNCSPDFLVRIGHIGPFLFEKDKCQSDPFWMLFTLWGFFWTNFAIFLFVLWKHKPLKMGNKREGHPTARRPASPAGWSGDIRRHVEHWWDESRIGTHLLTNINYLDLFVLLLFTFSTLLLIFPEFFYFKDIYPAHFRANTMFKLGYQAFMMMSFASVYTLYRLRSLPLISSIITKAIFAFLFLFIFIYPFFSFPSYYGDLKKTPQLNGSVWLDQTYPQDKEIITYLNTHIEGQPVILEAQGDSYTDYERISAYTGLPTVAGWWVHEWLWRGSPDVVGQRIPDIQAIYQSSDIAETMRLLRKYQVKYVIVSSLEREKYETLQEDKFLQIGKRVFESANQLGAIYQVN